MVDGFLKKENANLVAVAVAVATMIKARPAVVVQAVAAQQMRKNSAKLTQPMKSELVLT